MGSSRLRVFDPHLERKDSAAALSDRELPLPTFDVPYFKYIDEEDEDDEWSSRSQSSTEDDSVDSLLSDRYVVVSGTPEKILEHLLNDLHLEEVQDKETGFDLKYFEMLEENQVVSGVASFISPEIGQTSLGMRFT
ncbi:Rap guanine nucleotide exchange factor 5 [Saguinus oedipus]|uniref:Rap guanine nucleotide exchange factor 5 n=1 Tax=Saguinus oedipus TaxID=9490 RepID=A0ABQ9UGP2_SAGOE|nr:Rap guanine nucleotide exchange factor 5 [Saguinus oedipus]